jgi:hypothetical protein
MFEFIDNKHANKELQQYFDKNQEQLKNDPKAFANITTIYPQVQTFLTTLNAQQSTKEHIRTMLVNTGKTNITQLTQQELDTLQNQMQFKCAQGHAFD